MYLPDHFVEDRPDRLHALIRDQPLGTLVTCGTDGLTANQIPFILDPDAGEYGSLQGHVARNNPVWRDELLVPGVLVIFQGPAAYISPNWYPGKREHHRQVPTWNYLTVHAHGPLVIHDDVRWLRAQAGRLTRTMERERPVPWKMADAPRDYIEELLGQIVGIEIPIARLTGKAKLNQNKSDEDRAGAAAGLREAGGEERTAMAALIERAMTDLDR